MRGKRMLYYVIDAIGRYKWRCVEAMVVYVKLRKKREMGYPTFVQTNYFYATQEKKESLLFSDEYFEKCFAINPLNQLSALRNRASLIERIPHYLGRACLCLDQATEAEVLQFFLEHKDIYAKRNGSSNGNGICTFWQIESVEAAKAAYDTCIAEKMSIVEARLQQHPVLDGVFPNVVNNIRIHTLRTEKGIEIVFKPEIYIPTGEVQDTIHRAKKIYQVGIDEETGRLDKYAFCFEEEMGFARDGNTHHQDTHVAFGSITIPYWEEVKRMVCDAATYIPELTFIGWDVAITPTGPAIIEGNAISGAILTIQLKNAIRNGGYGMRAEILDILGKGVPSGNEA